MIFAEMKYSEDYWDFRDELVAYLKENFHEIQQGHQCDSWIWITDGNEKVAVDTFTSMKHQIKSAHDGALVQNVMATLSAKYPLIVYATPGLEAHEEQ